MFFKHLKILLWKEVLLEFRHKHAIGSIFLYLASTVFLIYIALQQSSNSPNLETRIWNVLFWLVILFTTVNAVAKSFFSENKGRMLYYYSVVNPRVFILSKIIYNFLIVTLLGVVSFGLFSLLIGNPIEKPLIFLLTLVLGASGYSFLFTLITAIASKAENNATLIAILGFPIVLPLIIFIIRLSKLSFTASSSDEMLKSIAVLFALDLILITLSMILFPYIWRD